MPDFQQQINQTIIAFVDRITALAAKAAQQALAEALHDNDKRPKKGKASKNGKAAKPRAKGDKRPAQEIEQTMQRFMAFVEDNPGMRIEQINAVLGTTTRDLALPIRKLLLGGHIKVQGEKRATAYFPAK